jgi:hypothetical protein
MLGELEALALIVGADALAIDALGRLGQRLIDKPADNLAVLENERHLVRAHFENGARALAAA